MASKQPIVKQTAWLSIIHQLIILSIFIVLASLTGTQTPAIIGALAYLGMSVVLKKTIAQQHRQGIAHLKKEEFGEALERFQESYDYFNHHRWIDDWRLITLLSSSRVSYREMALLNVAYCYGQLGEGARSREFYEKTLAEYPDSTMAKAAINMLDSAAYEPPQT
jgi:tetratricopeptide (TPR) repeat protein